MLSIILPVNFCCIISMLRLKDIQHVYEAFAITNFTNANFIILGAVQAIGNDVCKCFFILIILLCFT